MAGKTLVLNGAGARIKAVFKVYVLGLYLPEKKTTTADVLALSGPKKFKIVLLRDLSSEEFGQAFLTGINKNLDKDEKAKFVNQLVKLGDLFNDIEAGVKKGDVIWGEWNPAVGTTFTLNGKQVGSVLPDGNFYNAILRIWPQDNNFGKRLNCSLEAVQYVSPGERFGAKAVDVSSEFDDLSTSNAGASSDSPF